MLLFSTNLLTWLIVLLLIYTVISILIFHVLKLVYQNYLIYKLTNVYDFIYAILIFGILIAFLILLSLTWLKLTYFITFIIVSWYY